MTGNDELPEIEAVHVDVQQLKQFKSEEEFNAISVSLLVEAGEYLVVAACTMGKDKSWSRDRAAVGGNLVRLYKLISAFLDQICQRRRETSFIMARLVFETVVTVAYMVKNFSPELIDRYVRHSLRHERKLSDTISGNVAERGGVVLPIEDRMLKSIDRAVRFSEVPLDSIDMKDRKPWDGKDLRAKAADVGFEKAYLGMFGGASHNVHGSWQDLYEYHLEAGEVGVFSPRLEWRAPRPQVTLALAVITVETVRRFFDWFGASPVEDVMGALEDLDERLNAVTDAHEQYLNGRQWPQS
ncbi:DUF5677 domain-containing protein [Bosea psychrotolerans]|uniref:Uncharacterized protein n=1 Tax=Bosea psychrotolerans TaxID=1871628 RepID=A0A2S4M3W7_9HYPH|nr:DUF5677 domain-containing protein [Bosea psychrotolerans]POR49335.1 hypothetical protein CYD53_112160 [Bosea psychrotolerans]